MTLLRLSARSCRLCTAPKVTFGLNHHPAFARIAANSTEAGPRVATSSIWKSIIPKAFRHPDDPVSVAERQKLKAAKASQPKEWNPATFFILIALLIGSNAINMIALKNSRRDYSRKAEAKLALLREVVERVKKGEDVDVRGLLGTGNAEQEKEWEEVMKEIEEDESVFGTKRRKRAEKAQKKMEKEAARESPPVEDNTADVKSTPMSTEGTGRRPGFY